MGRGGAVPRRHRRHRAQHDRRERGGLRGHSRGEHARRRPEAARQRAAREPSHGAGRRRHRRLPPRGTDDGAGRVETGAAGAALGRATVARRQTALCQAADVRRARHPPLGANPAPSRSRVRPIAARSRSSARPRRSTAKSFDPYLGISRIAVYGLGDVDQAAAAIGGREARLRLRHGASARCSATATCGAPTRAAAWPGRSRASSAGASWKRRAPTTGLHRRVRSDRRLRLRREESRSLQGPARTRRRGARGGHETAKDREGVTY